MQRTTTLAALLLLTTGLVAQDKITLANGDVLTGTIKTMADGKVTIASPLLGDITVPMSNISDLVTQAQVDLQTKSGDLLKRRIVGVEGGSLRLEGDTTSLSIDNLGMINPPAEAAPTWTGTVKISGLYTDGNTDRRTAGASFDASRRSANDRISADAAWDYSEDKDNSPASPTFRQWTLTQRRSGGGLKYDYFVSKRLYTLVTARVLGDTFADIELRFTGGVGLGYMVIEDAKTTLATELGLSYFNETYRTPTTPGQDYLAARAAYKLTHALSDNTKLVHGVEAFPSLEDGADLYLQAKSEITTSLTESMIASIAHVLDYDNTPAPGFERVDNRVVVSVGWSF